jgi:hypothetical protein
MRTKTLVLSAIVGALSSASLMAQVYSLNAVGYINVTIAPGFQIIANQLNTTNNNISPLLDSQFSAGDKDGIEIFKFNGSSYTAIVADSSNLPLLPPWDGPATATTLNPGEAAFVYSPYTTNITLTFVGTVLQGNLTNNLAHGFSLASSLVPQAGRLDVDLGLTEVDGDEIFFFDYASKSYVFYVGDSSNLPLAPWDGSSSLYPASPTTTVGGGFFYYTVAPAGNSWVRTFTVN